MSITSQQLQTALKLPVGVADILEDVIASGGDVSPSEKLNLAKQTTWVQMNPFAPNVLAISTAYCGSANVNMKTDEYRLPTLGAKWTKFA